MLKIIERQGRKELLFLIKLNKNQQGPTHYLPLNLEKVFMCEVWKYVFLKKIHLSIIHINSKLVL